MMFLQGDNDVNLVLGVSGSNYLIRYTVFMQFFKLFSRIMFFGM